MERRESDLESTAETRMNVQEQLKGVWPVPERRALPGGKPIVLVLVLHPEEESVARTFLAMDSFGHQIPVNAAKRRRSGGRNSPMSQERRLIDWPTFEATVLRGNLRGAA
jgi:hypothetical protein